MLLRSDNRYHQVALFCFNFLFTDERCCELELIIFGFYVYIYQQEIIESLGAMSFDSGIMGKKDTDVNKILDMKDDVSYKIIL